MHKSITCNDLILMWFLSHEAFISPTIHKEKNTTKKKCILRFQRMKTSPECDWLGWSSIEWNIFNWPTLLLWKLRKHRMEWWTYSMKVGYSFNCFGKLTEAARPSANHVSYGETCLMKCFYLHRPLPQSGHKALDIKHVTFYSQLALWN